MSSIIPVIAPPGIAPNMVEGIRLRTSLSLDASVVRYGQAERINLYDTDHDLIASFSNAGMLWSQAGNEGASVLAGFYIFDIRNSGTMVARSVAGNVSGIFIGGAGDYLENSGVIAGVTQGGQATGITHFGPGISIHNIGGGTIAAQTLGDSLAGVAGSIGVYMVNGGYLFNARGSSILAEGGVARGVHVSGLGGDILNDGLIQARGDSVDWPATAISLSYAAPYGSRVINNGTIDAEIAITASQLSYNPFVTGTAWIENSAEGVIRGDILLELGDDLILNSGTIIGDISTGEGDDLVDLSAGLWIGTADLGWGDDGLIGSKAGDIVNGGRGDDDLRGGAGNDLLIGGVGNDMISGDGGNDGLYGEQDDDVISTSGGDVADGGDGDDLIFAGDLGFARLDGGAGFDTLAFGTQGLRLDLSDALASGRIHGFEGMMLVSGQQVAIRAGDAGTLADGVLRIGGAAEAGVELVGGWTDAGAAPEPDIGYHRYTLGSETILVAQTVPVTIVTTAGAGFHGLDPVAGGDPAPLIGSSEGAMPTDAELSITGYRLFGTVLIHASETWRTSGGGAALLGEQDAALINHGTIISVHDHNIVHALAGNQWDILVNHGTVRAVGTGNTGAVGYDPGSRGKLDNQGLIEAISDRGGVFAVTVGGAAADPAIFFRNSGTISGRSDAGAAVGAEISTIVRADNGPSAINSGRIEAIGGAGTVAVQMLASGVFRNDGTIFADGSASSGAQDAVGVQLYYSGINSFTGLENNGTIVADIAVRSDGGADRIVNTGRIEGAIRLNADDDSLIDSGVIVGAIDLGAGNDLYDGSAAKAAASVAGGGGDDRLVGTAFDDILVGGAGDDVIDGRGGGDIVQIGDALSDCTISFDGAVCVVTTKTEGVDRIANVETIAFAGVSVSVAALKAQYGDTTAPLLQGILPSDGRTAVATDAAVVLAFSEYVARGSGEIRIVRSDGRIVERFDVATSDRIRIDDGVVTVDPLYALAAGTRYRIEVDAGAITDRAENPYAGLSTHGFTTLAAPSPATGQARLIATGALTAEIGGDALIFGTMHGQDIRIADQPGAIEFDGSFARGGDVVRLTGAAADYQVRVAGSNIVFDDGDTRIVIPVGIAGMALSFDDGVRTLIFADGAVRIGGQAVSDSFAPLGSPAEAPPLSDPPAIVGAGRLVLHPGAVATVAGDIEIFGSNAGHETLEIRGGAIRLDGSFARGGDTIVLDALSGAFDARLAGSAVEMRSSGMTVSIPVGTAGITLRFVDGDRTLAYDEAAGAVKIGDQIVGAQSIGLTGPVEIPVTAFA
ncbi:Ig-like domain-containing protein [Sphingomonas colocasiae]|uniref:Ig-like domain-containing protein n=1 Tax=Sphingomonas colocasiae TaxID=1848973 RepID=A0ABS7PKT0_9SPHN|nr:Ig-like domain-containing protein [Sphingomonas colocasiae]MBY8821892.1 Ig-like domain-containing protein [Sphingomonas colocasiae]